MNEQEKSLKLAELMGWKIIVPKNRNIFESAKVPTIHGGELPGEKLAPYRNSVTGRAQFAAILLKFPEVIGRFCDHDCDCNKQRVDPDFEQDVILDEILRMNGINPNA